jgi:hypothetical protein
MSAGPHYLKPLPPRVRFGGGGGFFAYPSVQVRKCRQLRDFSISDKHRCPSWINRLFTAIDLDATDDRRCGPLVLLIEQSLAEVPESGVATAPRLN